MKKPLKKQPSKSRSRKSTVNKNLFETTDLLNMISILNEIVLEVDEKMVITRVLSQRPISILPDADECVGRKIKEVWHDDSVQVLNELILETQRDFSSRIFEFQPEQENKKWYGMKIISLRSQSGSPKTWIFIRDVTSRKTSDLDLESQKANAYNAARLASLGELAAGIGHEINNPLSIISAKAQQLRNYANRGTLSKEVVAETAIIINDTVKRVAKIVKALRSLSRDSESDPFVETSVVEIVDETMAVCSMKFYHDGIDLKLVNNVPDAMIRCRPTAIAQVLANLLNNAHDAVSDLSEKWIEVALGLNGHFIEVSVTDSGNGIPEEILKKIMQPFFTTKEPGKGTGLGLSISKSIVESHGGHLILDQTSPNTKFIIQIPCSVPLQAAG